MMFSNAFTVYALGLRHGADPDHLAAIDNLTRNSLERAPRFSRFIGTLFAGGHTIMVLAIAALVGYLGTRFGAHGAFIETAGTWISIVVLLAIAALNFLQLHRRQNDRIFGLKTRLMPAAIRNGTSPWLAVPVGLLFGFGFETSSQIATYAIAFAADAGVVGALIVGSMFCAGMICTDTLDSLFVHRVVSYRAGDLPRLMRVWIWAVTLFAVAVAGYELAQVLGWKSPLSDLTVSIILVASLLGVFVWIFFATRASNRVDSLNGAPKMKVLRSSATALGTAVLAAAVSLYGLHVARSSDHQDSPTVVNRPGSDITDVFVYPALDNPQNVVLAMDVYPLIPAGMAGSSQFALDPAVLYQFKIANDVASGDFTEKQVIQFKASAGNQGQTITMYGPAAPNEVGTTNTLVKQTGTFAFNSPATLNGQIQAFAGVRRDPFFFDLAQFFKIIPDRNYQNHAGASVPAPTASSFNGFPAGNPNGCLTSPASNLLANFNVIQIAVELPKTMLAPAGGTPGKIGVWATTSTTTGS